MRAPQELAEAMAKIDSLRHGKAVELLTAHFDAVGYPVKPPEGKGCRGRQRRRRERRAKKKASSTENEKEEKRESEPGAKEGKKRRWRM